MVPFQYNPYQNAIDIVMFCVASRARTHPRKVASHLYVWAAMSGFVFLATGGMSQDMPGSESVTLHVTDRGIGQPWDSQMKTGDLFYPDQLNVYGLKDVRSQILIPMPSDEDMQLSIEELSNRISSRLIQATKTRQQGGISEFELQLVEHIDAPGYVVRYRQDLVTKFGAAAYRAIDRLTESLEAQHTAANVDLSLGSNGTAVFAKNVDAWKPFKNRITHVDFNDGRAFWGDAARAISALGETKVNIINTKGDLWAPLWSIGNYDVSMWLKGYFPGITSLLLVPKLVPKGDSMAHTSYLGNTQEQYDVYATGVRFASGSRGGQHQVFSQDYIGTFTSYALRQRVAKMDPRLALAAGDRKTSVAPNSGNNANAKSNSDLGGIDFTALRLSYVHANTPMAVDTVYSMPKGNRSDLADLAGNKNLPGKGFRIAASMPEDVFWVNLNPKEPDRVADSRLGKTDVARVLLEADLQLKKDAAAITDPRTSPVGQEYWTRLEAAAGTRTDGAKIVQGIRVWIVPGKIEIAGDDQCAYIERAQMDVQLESQYLETQSPSGAKPGNQEGTLAATDAVARDVVLPILNDWVNRAPQYEELRQVFASLVLAQWYKDHHGLLDASDPDAKEWLSDPSWTPRATWLDYMYSLKNGEYNFSAVRTSSQGNVIVTQTEEYFDGGVDFTRISLPHLRPLANDELETLRA